MADIRKTLEERGARYGSFETHAQIAQGLKAVMIATPSWEQCGAAQKQAFEVIADKIARALNGDPDYDDNWRDIIGYAQLVLDILEQKDNRTKSLFEEVEDVN